MSTVTQKPTDISRMNIGEVFEHISSLPASTRGPEIKRICDIAPEIKLILQLTFNQSYEFDLPKGKPPFEPLNIPENFGYKRLGREMRKFRYFMKTLTPNMKRIKRESIFIEMLEYGKYFADIQLIGTLFVGGVVCAWITEFFGQRFP